jgi:hypothetical protein
MKRLRLTLFALAIATLGTQAADAACMKWYQLDYANGGWMSCYLTDTANNVCSYTCYENHVYLT